MEQVANLVDEGKISGISDVRDESDRSGMRIVIEIKQRGTSFKYFHIIPNLRHL